MKIQHKNNISITIYFLIGCYLIWFFFYNLREKMYQKKLEGKLNNLTTSMQGLFSGTIALFIVTSFNFLDEIIAKKTFFCQECFYICYIYGFILIGWFFSKIYLETKKEHIDFINNLKPAIISLFLFNDYILKSF
jgi:putative Mn2+ efflux pump MntP